MTDFNPANYLRQLRGRGGTSEYLDVKWRLVWLRQEHPDAIIDSEKLEGGVLEKYAVFRASVTVPGGGRATAHGSETAGDFADYLEKAETKAVGRALAMLGYGTQFTDNELDAPVVDAPVERPAVQGNGHAADARPAPLSGAKAAARPADTDIPNDDPDDAAADAALDEYAAELRQRQDKIVRLARAAGMEENGYANLRDYMETVVGKRSLKALTLPQADTMIKRLEKDEADRLAKLQAQIPSGSEAR